MKRSSHLNKLKNFIFLIFILIFNQNLCFAAVDIWEKKEKNKQEGSQSENENNITIEDPIFSDDTNKVKINFEEKEIDNYEKSIIGIFDPAENNFNLNMWSETDGEEIKKILKRIDKLKLSKPSEDLLFLVLFTNAYPPKANLSSEGFLNIKINWLIKKKEFMI